MALPSSSISDVPVKNFDSFSALEDLRIVDSLLGNYPARIYDLNMFKIVPEALRSITDPANHHEVPEFLQHTITSIQVCLARNSDTEIKDSIMRRVAGKIDELTNLPLEKKERIVQEQGRALKHCIETVVLPEVEDALNACYQCRDAREERITDVDMFAQVMSSLNLIEQISRAAMP